MDWGVDLLPATQKAVFKKTFLLQALGGYDFFPLNYRS